MDSKQIEQDIQLTERVIERREQDLAIARKELVHAQTQLADAIVAESKKQELVNGDYGKIAEAGWGYLGGKIYWDDFGVAGLCTTDFAKYRKGNIFREMEERQE